jgi:hypothetical protein
MGRAQRTQFGESGSSERRTAGCRGKRRNTCQLWRRPGDLRHSNVSAEGCCLPTLTWFTGARCTGPNRHHTRQVFRSGESLAAG